MSVEQCLAKYLDSNYSSYNVSTREHHSITDKIAVIDLDETLLRTSDTKISEVQKLELEKNPEIIKRLYIKTILIRDTEKTQSSYQFWGVLRPKAREDFIPFANVYFRAIIIWTAGIYPYARSMVKEIFKGYQGPFIYLSRRDCSIIDGDYTKPLYMIERRFPEFKVSKMLIIDDRKVSFKECPNNGILIPPYKPSDNASALQVNDIALEQLKYWLLSKEVMEAEDVTKLDKREIFSYGASFYKDQIPRSIVTRYHFVDKMPVKNEVALVDPYI